MRPFSLVSNNYCCFSSVSSSLIFYSVFFLQKDPIHSACHFYHVLHPIAFQALTIEIGRSFFFTINFLKLQSHEMKKPKEMKK